MAAIRGKFVALALCIASAAAFAGAPAPANGVAPESAMLAQDGRRLVFGEAAEDGARAIQVYDAQGRIVRELALGDFLPAAYVRALPRGEAGLQWRREARLVGEQVEFSVPTPGSAAGATGAALSFSIDLRDGAVRTAQIREYLAAADEAMALEAKTAPTPLAAR
jgi:hypothetical protein